MVTVRMSSWRPLSIALCAIFLAPLVSAQNYQGRELVKATLLADTSAIVPGKPFTAGLFLRMAPGWHTYWKFSGDAGLPTEIKWKLPPGWKVGEIEWPIPLKTNDPGDIQTYGYQDEILLMQEITPPAKIDISPVKLSAEANWLVCEKICLSAKKSAFRAARIWSWSCQLRQPPNRKTLISSRVTAVYFRKNSPIQKLRLSPGTAQLPISTSKS